MSSFPGNGLQVSGSVILLFIPIVGISFCAGQSYTRQDFWCFFFQYFCRMSSSAMNVNHQGRSLISVPSWVFFLFLCVCVFVSAFKACIVPITRVLLSSSNSYIVLESFMDILANNSKGDVLYSALKFLFDIL